MNPAQLSISLQALEQIEAHAHQIDQQWQLRLERANYAADLARRRYTSVEPENRLVARSLEKDWNEKLVAVERLEREYAARTSPAHLVASPEERLRIVEMAQDFDTVWTSNTTSNTERKRLLRYLIKDVTLTSRDDNIHLGVRWQTGATSEIEIPRRKRVDEIWRTPDIVIERVRSLVATQTDRQNAAILSQ
jgi:hypothetical protein